MTMLLRLCVFATILLSSYPHITAETLNPTTIAARVQAMQQALITEGICLSNTALVAHRGKTIYHQAVNAQAPGDRPITDETLFPIWSMTKPITCVAAMILHERGLFNLDDPVAKVIPALGRCTVEGSEGKVQPLKRPITYRHLFQHTAGFDGYDGSFHEEGTWKAIMEMESLEEVVSLLVSQPLQHQPGERHTYGINHAVLGHALEKLTKQPFAEILREGDLRPTRI